MTKRPLRVLFLASHPVQYASPIFARFAKDPRVEIKVAFCSMQGTDGTVDRDFGVPVAWDIPLLQGFPWIALRNRSPRPRVGSFFGLINPQVWSLIRSGNFDAVIAYTGYVYVTFWIALAAAKFSRVPILFGTDAHQLAPRDGKAWKLSVKKRLWPRLFKLADQVIVSSSGGVALMRSLGIPEQRIALTPYVVNNDWWIEKSNQASRSEFRQRWNIPEPAVVVVFSAKLQAWKRPADVLRAFARLPASDAYLIFAGEGPLRAELESEAKSLGVADRTRFLGFVNQTGLPDVYSASDILVLPSEYEPFGVVVNEAMLCGCCPVVSDRVGARFDLVKDGETGFVFRTGDIDGLASILHALVSDCAKRKLMREAARVQIQSWSPELGIDKTVEAVERSLQTDAPSNIAASAHLDRIS
jgi:glycosyltransferase involved in cell wall biosynthesis